MGILKFSLKLNDYTNLQKFFVSFVVFGACLLLIILNSDFYILHYFVFTLFYINYIVIYILIVCVCVCFTYNT